MPYGDRALLLNFDQRIDLDVHRAVMQVTAFVRQMNHPGVTFCVPAYCSVTVGFDPQIVHFSALEELLSNPNLSDVTGHLSGRKFRIPVCYDPEYAPDLAIVSEQTGLTEQEIITLHTEPDYHVYMLGFRPGFVYLGKVPAALATRRKDIPRKRVPPRSVGVAGLQTGIYPAVAPGGWQIIGRTPAPTFVPAAADPFLLRPGDTVKFYRIERAECEEWTRSGGFKLEPDA